jgi:diaminopimelate decarboxylase
VTGIDMHIGSQITELQPFDDAIKLLRRTDVETLRAEGHDRLMSMSAAGSASPTATTTMRRRHCPMPMPRSSRIAT